MYKREIENLEPKLLWKNFVEITQVPRPSKKEEKIRKYVKDFASKNNLKFKEDKIGNICIRVPATSGFEKSKTIVLQGHLDMVCEKNKDKKHDFEKDALQLIKDDEWVKADGTTLGADNGIGVAAALAIALDKEAKHGPIEILLTIDEETGLTGVNNISKKLISGNILLNLDSEEDGAFYVGCSGGIDTQGEFEIDFKKCSKKLTAKNLLISGLTGGHSGLDIHKGRGNAIKILGLLVNKLFKYDVQIGGLGGGSKRNAIPREAMAVILFDKKSEKKIKNEILKFENDLKSVFKTKEEKLKIDLFPVEKTFKKVFSKKFSKRLINTILALPHGVISMSSDIPDLVETSTNLATIVNSNGKIIVGTSQRSSVESSKVNLAEIIKAVFTLAKADEISQSDGYPGWKPNMDSELLKISKKVYVEKFNNEPEVKAIHAGLECGILGGKFENLDMISFGPTIEGAHSPHERVNIKTIAKFYELLKAVIEHIAKN